MHLPSPIMLFDRSFDWSSFDKHYNKCHFESIAALMDASQPNVPVSDLDVAAQYADAELHSVTAQFASAATVSVQSEVPKVPIVTDSKEDDSDSSEDEETSAEKETEPTKDNDEASSDDDSDDEDPVKLRAEIEAAMEKEENKADGPLTTTHEVVKAPVREPCVELTADCPIAQCGTILNVSVPGLMMTIKSNANTKPLDEGSVLCLEDRTVLGCVDEVFGPVLMPMYLLRFENAAKMPEKATVNATVYFATEHTTYIVPENIKDKGTDASNIFDEEANETEFSDDEAEAAAKRGNRKRNRGGAPSTGNEGSSNAPAYGGRGGRGGNFSDYQARSNVSPHGGRGNYGQQPPMPPTPAMPAIPAMQTQPYGGVTKYTQPGGFGGARPPVPYGVTNYTSPRGATPSQAPMAPYNGMSVPQGQQAPPRGYYQPLPPQYNAHNLPPYPPQAPPPQAPYQAYPQPPRAPYAAPQYNQPQHGVPPPPPVNRYYGQQQQQPPPPPPQQPHGPYDQQRRY